MVNVFKYSIADWQGVDVWIKPAESAAEEDHPLDVEKVKSELRAVQEEESELSNKVQNT